MTKRITARRIDIRGIVQGVGFRPFVFRLAHENSIRGWVRNDSRGVCIHAEGAEANLDAFVSELLRRPPQAASISDIETRDAQFERCADFQIVRSSTDVAKSARISPDLAVCDECLQELHNPTSRRFMYPYINCTLCGPRYSIIQKLPYDRVNTTMSRWQLCAECDEEYKDPLDRRFHAQPTACCACGPNYVLQGDGIEFKRGPAAIRQAVEMLQGGKLLALKGIGGYHLACAARNDDAVRRLRERKFRKQKPFAVMVRDCAEAHRIAHLTDLHRGLLCSRSRPIVLAKSDSPWPNVAPNTSELGLMLPYAPLHELLFHAGAPHPLVLTSANRSSEPIAYKDADALERLAGIADAFLIGERPIARRVDDSVVAVRDQQTTIIRRARGFAPSVVAKLPTRRPILAVGADLKNSIALVVGGEVTCSQHIGDLGQLETNQAFQQTVSDLLEMYGVKHCDLIVAHDAHPDYFSTQFAKGLECHSLVSCQHHRAHIASVLAETGDYNGRVVGVAMDGTGYGDDGTIWGCELFTGSVSKGFQRVSHLRPTPLPGGDAAARYPIQAAAGFLSEIESLPDLRQPPFSFPERFSHAQNLVATGARCFRSSSAGRLFDTVAALCGFTREISYEGQAAVWLENLADGANACEAYSFCDLDPRALLAAVISDRLAGRDVSEISYAFHAGLASSLIARVNQFALANSIDVCVVSGGVLQNRLLRSLLTAEANRYGVTIKFNSAVPTNDGGIALGQAAMACFDAAEHE